MYVEVNFVKAFHLKRKSVPIIENQQRGRLVGNEGFEPPTSTLSRLRSKPTELIARATAKIQIYFII